MTANGRYDPRALADRAEIGDVIYLYAHAMDRHRWTLMDQVFHADATVEFSSRGVVQPYRDWLAGAQAMLGPLTATLHQIGNVLIEIDGDAAWSEAYVTAVHRVPPTAPKDGFWDGRDEPYEGIAGARYIDRFERRDGRWRIAARKTIIEWRHDRPVRDGGLAEQRGGRGDADPSRDVVASRL